MSTTKIEVTDNGKPISTWLNNPNHVEPPPKEGYWYVVSTYSAHYTKKYLIQVHSRRFKHKFPDAEGWKEFCESQEAERKIPAYRRKKFALIYIEKGTDFLGANGE